MYHSVTFGSKNSYDDWHLVPNGRPVISAPSIKNTLVEIPGLSGSLDFSELLTKFPTYSNRTGKIQFYVLNDYTNNQTWIDRYHEIMNYIHGRISRITLEDDPSYFYEGRINIDSWTSNNDGSGSTISFGYNVDPYKYYYNANNPNDDGMMVYTGVNNFSIALGNNVGIMPVVPDFIVTNIGSSGLNITWTNRERGIINSVKEITENGTHTFYDLILTNLSGENNCSITVTGTGNTKILFRKGML